MNDLLALALTAHGGESRWKTVKSIEVTLEISGGLMEVKGFTAPLVTTISVSNDEPKTTMQPYGGPDCRGVYTADKIWIETLGGEILSSRTHPRAAFAGHTRQTPWDELHRLYFLGYATWNYICSPFLFTRTGFETRELAEHSEDGEIWRVLEVIYAENVPTHCPTQLFYFDREGHLKRVDYVTDVAGGIASHYCYDHKTFDGLVIPTRRRVVRRTPEGPKMSGPTAVFLDYKSVVVRNR